MGSYWRGAVGMLSVLLLAVLVWGAWHLYVDHQSHHKMVGGWNTYGPMLEEARKAAVPPQAPAAASPTAPAGPPGS